MNRYFKNRTKKSYSNKRTNLFAILTLVAILSAILLLFTNERQNEQVLKSYCGDFGFFGKSLVLMKDSTFRFSYHGCNQNNGHVKGTWVSDGATIKFEPKQHEDNLDLQYHLSDTELIPFNKSSFGKFTLCEYYEYQWERIESN